MKYKNYIGIAQFDEEAEVFFGRVINTRDTITFQSSDAARLVDEFKASVDDYLNFCRKKGYKPERPYSGRLSLRLPPELHEQLAAAAASKGMSLNEYILSQLTAQHYQTA
jgi:predicted HicB family RNase H-like nuclease